MKSFTNWTIQLDCLDFGLSIRRMLNYKPSTTFFLFKTSTGFQNIYWTSQLINRCSRKEGKGKDGGYGGFKL
jgi:hypothetical protein